MFGARSNLTRFSKRFINIHSRRNLCKSTSPDNNLSNNPNNLITTKKNKNATLDDYRHLEAYRDLDNLDFEKAAKLIFYEHPRKKWENRLDFHLVQLFFALLPSCAVYLVAQYARYEIRRMEAEVEAKKKAEEEKKAKEMEATAAAEKGESDTELLKVKDRLNTLEETLKEIASEIKKRPSDDKSKSTENNQERVDPNSKSEDQSPSAKSITTQDKTLGSGQPLKKQDIGEGESQKDESK